MAEGGPRPSRAERIFVGLNAAAIVALLAVMCVVVGWNVGLRYLTGTSLSWADEVARYTMIWMCFVGAGLALREGAHVALTNFQTALPLPAARALRGVVLVLLMFFFAVMIWMGWDYMTRARFQLSAALRLKMFWVYAAMPVGFALLVVHLALIARAYLRDGLEAEEAEVPR
ncbi:TRAP-type C4-dicarboxylate transport system, small permease component [Paracoccus isoporae]|uniref:TRAP transporter small permease protein n=2 Tax=Paracoccus isoporae TaxID=591205 RepID=A0A1G6TM31_9RHOB|nr:TRAP-type C4-dicarboxylate transport system, small permease component [Paracoccus isoporae]